MKIENKKINNFLTNLLSFEEFKVDPICLDTSSSDFKAIVSGLTDLTHKPPLFGFPNPDFMTGSLVIPQNDDNIMTFNLDPMNKEDIEFFKLIAEKKEITINNVNPKDMQVTLTGLQDNSRQISYKTVNFSKGLFNLIEYSFKTQKPVRLDFQGKSSVILKINTEGKLTAEFISNDAAMEYALKSSIPGLRHKMNTEGIPYQEIYYKDKENKKDQNNKERRNKGGNQ